MKRTTTTLVLLITVLNSCLWAASRGDEAKYIGGTLVAIPDKTDGRLDTSQEKTATFSWKKGEVAIPYNKITSLEYGQRQGALHALCIKDPVRQTGGVRI